MAVALPSVRASALASALIVQAPGGSYEWSERDGVIVRVLRARVKPAKVGPFNAIFRTQVPLLKRQPGLVYVKLARRLRHDGSEEVILFEEWESAAALYAWVGPDLNAPRLVDGADELIDDILVAHYEVLDGESDEAPATNSAADTT